MQILLQTMYGKDLIAELKSELSANFLRLCKCMLLSIPQFLAKELKRAMKVCYYLNFQISFAYKV